MTPTFFAVLTETADMTLPFPTLDKAKEVYSALLRAAKAGQMSGWPELQENPPAVIVKYSGTSAKPSPAQAYIQKLPTR